MKDLKEFQKLFKFNFPIEDNYEYYVETLSKSIEFSDLGGLIKDFEQYEQDIESDPNHKSLRSYKLDYALPKLKNFIKSTCAYSNLINCNFSNIVTRTKNELESVGDEFLISVDFSAANFNTMKLYDAFDELGSTWKELCDKQGIHPTLAKSKSFRQLVFGNVNPKLLQKVQHSNIIQIIGMLTSRYGYTEEDFVCISHDEFIIKRSELSYYHFYKIQQDIDSAMSEIPLDMKLHYKIYKSAPVLNGVNTLKLAKIHTIFEFDDSDLIESHKTLFAISGDKFYKYFKIHILEEPLDRRDLMFMSDGDIAIFSEGEDCVVETISPDGEITMDEVIKKYPKLLGRIKKEVPGLSKSHMRKLVNIFVDSHVCSGNFCECIHIAKK